MTDAETAELVSECYATHYILTNMGFEPEEVQATARRILNASPPGLYVCMMITRPPGFIYHIRLVSEEEAVRFQTAWLAFAAKKPTMPQAELERMVGSSRTWATRAELLWALEMKGFELRPGAMVH